MTALYKTVLPALAAIVLLGGCVTQKQNTDGCGPQETEQGLRVSFYSRSRCQDAASWPEDIEQIMLFVFDGDGILAYQRMLDGVELTADYFVDIPTEPGLYTVIGWAGLRRQYFEILPATDGTTSKEDLLLSIGRSGEDAEDIRGVTVYTGESNAVYVEETEPGTDYKKVAVNLQEVTNRLAVSVEGLPTDAEDYTVTIEADNGSMNYDGTIAGDEVLVYRPVLTYGDGTIEGDFTLLKLETGHSYYIVVRNEVSGTLLYRGSLLGALILKNPEVDLACDHDFIIRFTAEDQCDCGTYAIAEIYVNNWLVHSYETDL